MGILKAVKVRHSHNIHGYCRIKRQIAVVFFAFTFVLLLLSSQVFASDDYTITFDEALRLALACDPGVVSARDALELAKFRLAAIEALRFPALTLTASPLQVSWAERMQLPPVPEGVWSKHVSSGIGLGAVVPVGDGKVSFSVEGLYSMEGSEDPVWTDGWRIDISLPIMGKSPASTGSIGLGGTADAGIASYEDQVRLAKAAVKNAEFELDRAIAKAKTGLEAAYHGVFRDTGRLEAAHMNLERMKQHSGVVEARYAQGNAGELDLIDAKQGVKSAEIAVEATSHALVVSKMSLNRLTGRDLNTPLTLEPVGEYESETLLSPDEYVNLALKQRQEPVLAEENLARARIELDIARSALLPQVWFRGQADNKGSWTVGVSLSKVLSRDYAAELSVKSAENTVATAERNIVAAKEAIVLDVTTAYYALLDAEAQLSLAQSALEKAALVLSVRETQYTAGAATHQDVASAIAALSDAEIDLANARANCFTAKARLADAVGAK